MSNVYYALKKTIRNYANGGNLLIAATVLALIAANVSAVSPYYNEFWTQKVSLQIGSFNLFSHHGEPMSLMTFINDALMAVFFFTVGLEIKREVLVGELSSIKQALLPVIAALGGMIIPVAIFWYLAKGTDYIDGCAIPMATDIAFSLGVLAMFDKRVPLSLKVFLTTLAVVDDIGGILVIAIFYSSHIAYTYLIAAAVLLGVILLGSFMKIQSKSFYILLGVGVWFLFLNSGIHPTIAGVIVAFCIPATPVHNAKKFIVQLRESMATFPAKDYSCLEPNILLTKDQMNLLKEIESASDKIISPLQELEDSLHPIVTYFIIPLFAFANAGVFLGDMEVSAVYSGLALAIICGLVIGKLVGIFLFSFAAIKLKIVPMPEYSCWKSMAAVSMLVGIGFRVPMFFVCLFFVRVAVLFYDASLCFLFGS